MGVLQRFKEWRERRRDNWHIVSSMHELKVGAYMQIKEICNSEREDIDKSTAILRVLTGWSESDIESLSLTEYASLVSGCSWLYDEPQAVDVRRTYKVGDYELRPTEAEDITFAQFVDFQQFAKDVDKYFVEVLSTILVPIGKRYGEGYKVRDVRKWIERSLPADEALSIIAFFLAKSLLSQATIAISLEQIVREAPARTTEQMKEKAIAMAHLRNISAIGGGISTEKP